VNVINWSGRASHFTFRKHTPKIWGPSLPASVMYITDRASWGAQNPNSIRPDPLFAEVRSSTDLSANSWR
jgi:hypothetical protein